MVEKAKGEEDLIRRVIRICDRAKELDPSIGEDPTVEVALEVLKRHGKSPGFSDEVLELLVWLPQEEEED